MRTPWEKIFTTVPVPEWLLTFDARPDAAVDAALRGRYFFGALNVAEPSDLLIDWALGIGEQFGFVQHLDKALANWIEKNWGRANYTLAAMSWIWLSQIVANVESLQKAPQALRRHFHDRQKFLAPLCAGLSRDPLGMYLNAVARHQADVSLAEVWWDYCNLAPGIPWHHGLYGIVGLRGLPPKSEKARGAFPEVVARGVACLGRALYRQSEEQKISREEAHDEFDNVTHLTIVAYPFPERWRECWQKEIDGGNVGPTIFGWMKELVPELKPPTLVFPPDRLKEIEDIINMLESPQRFSAQSVAVITGIRGIGKTTILREFVNLLQRRQNFRSAYIDLRKAAEVRLQNPNAIISDIVKQIDGQNDLFKAMASPSRRHKKDLTPLFTQYLQSLLSAGQRRYFVVLLFDAIEESLPIVQEWLVKVITQMAGTERLFFALAHDVLPGLTERLKPDDQVYSFRPKEFDFSLVQQQLQFSGFFNAAVPSETKRAYAIYAITQGHPLATKMIAQKALEEGYKAEDIKNHYPELIRFINRKIIFPQYRKTEIIRLKPLLTPLAIPRQFTIGSMEQLIGQFAPRYRQPNILKYGDTINELYDEKGVIRYDKDLRAFKVISPLRGVFAAELRTQNHSRFIEINRFLVNCYNDWLQEAHGMVRTQVFLEKVYHLLQIGNGPTALLLEFEGFVAHIRQDEPEDQRQELLRKSWEAFQLDADVVMQLDEAVKRKIDAIFGVHKKRERKQILLGGK